MNMEHLEACRRFAQALVERVRGGARPLAAALLAAGALWASPAPAANPGRLNIGIGVQGIAGVSDLQAAGGSLPGEIQLTWTEPQRSGASAPYSYDIRVSTTGQIGTHAQFLAAKPLSDLSGSPVPAPGAGGGQAGMVVSGLVPGVVHYFAIRQIDFGGLFGAWFRGGAAGWNLYNFAPANSAVPNPVTNLTALAGPGEGQVALSWTAPAPPTLSHHEVRFATFSVASVGGSTTAWLALTQSSVVAAGVGPGGLQTAILDLEPAERYFFAVRSSNTAGMGPLDSLASVSQREARAKGAGAVTNLAAAAGPSSNQVTLTWTEPFVSSITAPASYQLRVSTVGFIDGATGFAAAQPLSAFSATPLPAYGSGGAAASLAVSGLTPGVTHYFALRLVDGSTPTLAGVWLRDPAAGRNASPAAAPALVLQPPLAVTNLSALPGSGEGEVALTWTAPSNPNLVSISSYELRMATVPVSAFGGSTTAWWNAASSQPYGSALAPGALESRVATGLLPTATWYFALKSIDATGQVSPIDAYAAAPPQASALPQSVAPSVPSGLAATAGVREATVSWTPLSPAGLGLDFAHYRLERSSNPPAFVSVTTTTAASFTDAPLKAKTTWYYRVVARDLRGNESAASSTASVVPFTILPMEPLGLTVAPSSAAVSFSWSATTRFGNGLGFLAPAAPDQDELQGYSIFRATSICSPGYVHLSSVPVSTLTYTDWTGGANYFYRLASYNTEGVSSNVVTFSALGDRAYLTDDCGSAVYIDPVNAAALNSATNGRGSDVRLYRDRRPEDTGGVIFQSVEFKALLDGVTPLKDFVLPKPALIALRYEVQNGQPVASTSPASGSSILAGGTAPTSFNTKDLGMFWNNGAEFKKMYGVVDPVAQTVTVESPNLGVYQIRAQYRSGGVEFDLSNVSNRVITPNGDHKNDLLIITYDPGASNAGARGRIYDIQGQFVADMTAGQVPNTLVWDGRMNGRPVSSGVYIYKIEGGGKTYTGSVVVAR